MVTDDENLKNLGRNTALGNDDDKSQTMDQNDINNLTSGAGITEVGPDGKNSKPLKSSKK
jgi:hypothetical protein